MKLRSRFNKLMQDWLMVRIDGKTVYVWHSRRLQEIIYMHIPRFLFLSGAIYTIYLINLQVNERQKWKRGVVSHR